MTMNLKQSIERMTDGICAVLDHNVHSIWLYGSVVLNDFRAGWSDIDLLVLTDARMTEHQAGQLAELRQTMLKTEPDNPYYRSFEGIIADANEYPAGPFTRLVYWGTSGQKVTDHYQQDVFSLFELARYGRSVYGEHDRSIFAEPSVMELREAVRQHYETIRRFAVRTDERLYSCGWLLDIARCIYTLRNNDVIAKTQAGVWALTEHVFEDEEPLKEALRIRRNPPGLPGTGRCKAVAERAGALRAAGCRRTGTGIIPDRSLQGVLPSVSENKADCGSGKHHDPSGRSV